MGSWTQRVGSVEQNGNERGGPVNMTTNENSKGQSPLALSIGTLGVGDRWSKTFRTGKGPKVV